MKLSEYFSTVAHVLTRHKTDAEVGDALAEAHGMGFGGVNGTFIRVMGEVRDALNDNKKILGVFDDGQSQADSGPRDAEGRKSVKEKEIQPDDLKRHILAVRHSLRGYKEKKPHNGDLISQYDSPESIIERILSDLTMALGVEGLGRVFGPEERQAYGIQFGREKMSDGNSSPPMAEENSGDDNPRLKWRENMPPAGTPEYDRFAAAVMDRLRKEGKIK